MSITEDLGPLIIDELPRRKPAATSKDSIARFAKACASVGIGAREALATIIGVTLILVLLAPRVRWLVPVGAPGSTVPNWIMGPLAPLAGSQIPFGKALALGLFAVMAMAWIVVVADADSLPFRAVVWGIGIVYALLLIAPPLLSTDVFTYLSAGRLEMLHGVNPYLHGPVVRPQDPVFAWTGLIWCDTPTVYGPLFSLLSAGLAGFGLAFGLWALKLIAVAAAAACAALTWSIAKQLDRPPVPATLFVALNPVLLAHAIGGAHNDLLMLATVLVAVKLCISAKPAKAGAAVAVAVAIKATAGLVLPFLIIGARGYAERGGRLVALGFAAAGAIVGGIGIWIYGLSWLAIPITVSRGPARHVGELNSVPGFLAGYLRLGAIGPVTSALLVAAAVVSIGLSIRFALKGGDRWLAAAAFAVVSTLAFSTQLHAWYILLCLPLAALSNDPRARKAAIAITIAVLVLIPSVRALLPIGGTWPYGG